MNLDQLDDTVYNVDDIETDMHNGNFNPDNLEAYRYENIVQASITNGQFPQARQQCMAFGLNYAHAYYLNKVKELVE